MAKRKRLTEDEIQARINAHEEWQRSWATPDRLLYLYTDNDGNLVSGSVHVSHKDNVPANATIVPTSIYLAVGRIAETLYCLREYGLKKE